MTTYQAGEFLGPQLESIASQSLLPDELVVFDDASTDGTWQVLSEFAARAPFRCQVTRQENNVGLHRNVQRALTACTAAVIVLADQDDLWEPDKVASLAEAFGDPEVMLWFSDAELIDPAGRPLGRRSWDAVNLPVAEALTLDSDAGLRRLLHGMTVTGATMAVRRDILGVALPLPTELQGENHLFLHDGWLAVLAAVHGRVVADPRALTRYRQHPSQITAMSMTRESHGPKEPDDRDLFLRGTREDRRRDLLTESARVRLVTQRLRNSTPGIAPVPQKAAYLHDLQHFLDVRTLPRNSKERRLRVVQELISGAYARHARGVRTALGDLR